MSDDPDTLARHHKRNEALWRLWAKLYDLSNKPLGVQFHFSTINAKLATAHIAALKAKGFAVQHHTQRFYLFFKGHIIIGTEERIWDLESLQSRTAELWNLSPDQRVALDEVGAMFNPSDFSEILKGASSGGGETRGNPA
jgi:hypothetical protein